MISIWNLQSPTSQNDTMPTQFSVPTSGTYTFFFTGSAWTYAGVGGAPCVTSVSVTIDNNAAGSASLFANNNAVHLALVSGAPVSLYLEAGSHVAELSIGANTIIDGPDFFTLWCTPTAV